MRYRLSGLSTYRLNGHRKKDEHSANTLVGYGTLLLSLTGRSEYLYPAIYFILHV